MSPRDDYDFDDDMLDDVAATTAAPQPIPCPDPGIYRDTLLSDYLRWDAPSASFLFRMYVDSPEHARYERQNPKKETPALVRGAALHAAVLTPGLFDGLYAVAGPCEAVIPKTNAPCKNGGKKAVGGQWWCGTHVKSQVGAVDSRTTLPSKVYDDCRGMRDKARAHPRIRAVLDGTPADAREVSLVYRHEPTGLLVKARPDLDCAKYDLACDVKTSERNVHPLRKWSISMYEHGWHVQAANHLAALAANGLKRSSYLHVAISPSPPYGIRAYSLAERALTLGRRILDEQLLRYAQCVQSSTWPGLSLDVEDADLPEWCPEYLEEEVLR